MDNNNNNSGVNTILIVLVLLIVVAVGVWFLRGGFGGSAPQENTGLDVNVELPDGSSSSGGSDGGSGGQ